MLHLNYLKASLKVIYQLMSEVNYHESTKVLKQKEWNELRERLKSDLSEKVIEYLFEPSILAERERSFSNMMNVNQAHLSMLLAEGIVEEETGKKIKKGLDEIAGEGKRALYIDPKLEDLYFNIEKRLIEKVGTEAGGQLHTGRSRNDLYTTVLRMNTRDSLLIIMELVLQTRHVILQVAKENTSTVISGYTHMQPAEPITLGHYFSALGQAFERDSHRLVNAFQMTNCSPLGSGAMAGTTFPINRETTAKQLGFCGVLDNSLDGIASRDYLLESLSAMNILMNHTNRIAQDLYIWSTDEFGTVAVGDSVAASSSIMPQKKNPITFEHMKAKSSHVLGAYVSATGCLSNISYGHCRDLSESATYLWEAFKEVEASLNLFNETVQTLSFNEALMLERAVLNFTTVTELANVIVREEKISFRQAHHIVGNVVNYMLEHRIPLTELSSELIEEIAYNVLGQKIALRTDKIESALNPILNVKSKNSKGGPAPEEVKKQIGKLEIKLKKDERFYDQLKAAIMRSKAELDEALV